MDAQIVKNERTDAGSKPWTKSSFLARTRNYGGLTREDLRIIEETLAARDEWVAASSDFNYADDDLLVDYHIYRLKACEARYTYFLKLAKEKGLALRLDCHNYFNVQV